MKQFLILAVSLPVLLIFIAQFSLQQINSAKISLFTELVCAAKEEAKETGCFSEDITSRLKENISRRLKIEPDLIEIEADSTVKYRIQKAGENDNEAFQRGLIHYRVKAPIGKIMAGAGLLGIEKQDNIYYYCIESYTASERLP